MPQDPQSTLFAILRETGETLLVTSEYVQQSVGEFTLQGPKNDILEDFFKVVVKADDKSAWAPQGYGKQDYLLFSSVTHQFEPQAEKSLGNAQLLPVLFMLKDEEVGDSGGLKNVTLGEGIIDASLTYDTTTATYHLWYMIHGWTSKSKTNNVNNQSSLLVTASKQYSRKDAIPFNVEDWWVVPQRNLTISEMPCAAKILLHTVGTKFILTSGTDPEFYLVNRDPQIVAYWPFECVSSSSRASRPPSSSKVSVSVSVPSVSVSVPSVSARSSVRSSARSVSSVRSLPSVVSSVVSVPSVSRPSVSAVSAVSVSKSARRSSRISISAPSECPKFTGCIDIICDARWNPDTCTLDKVRGKLTIERGRICEDSGCEPDVDAPCDEPLLGPLSLGFRKFWSEEVARAAILVPDLQSSQVRGWLNAVMKGSVDIRWTNIVTDGRIDSDYFDELTMLGAKVHTIPHQVSASEKSRYLKAVMEGIAGGVEALVFWTREDQESFSNLPIPKIGYHMLRSPPPEEADYLVVGSTTVLRSLSGRDQERAKMIRTGVDAPSFISRLGRKIAREHWNLKLDEKVILSPEIIGPHTKQILSILDHLPESWTIILLNDGGIPRDIHEMAVSQWPNRVKLIPRVSRLGDYIPAVDAVLWSQPMDYIPEEIVASWMNRVPVVTPLAGEIQVLTENRRPFFWAIPRTLEPKQVSEIVHEAVTVEKGNVQLERAHRMAWNELSFANTAVAWENLVHDVVKEWWG